MREHLVQGNCNQGRREKSEMPYWGNRLILVPGGSIQLSAVGVEAVLWGLLFWISTYQTVLPVKPPTKLKMSVKFLLFAFLFVCLNWTGLCFTGCSFNFFCCCFHIPVKLTNGYFSLLLESPEQRVYKYIKQLLRFFNSSSKKVFVCDQTNRINTSFIYK